MDLVTFGEAMVRLTPPAFQRLEQAHSFDAYVGGGELNVAVGAARLGVASRWVSRLPDNALGRMIASRARELLRIPEGVPFSVRPRLDTSKTYYYGGGVKKSMRELIFKVAWDVVEPNPKGSWLPDNRQITVGTTLAIDWDTKQVKARLTSQWEEQRDERDKLLQRLDEKGLLVPAELATNPDGKPLRCAIKAETSGNLMRVRGTARTLHIAEA
jgi:hypothetical protein